MLAGPDGIVMRIVGRFKPTSQCHLLPRVEMHTFGALDMQIAEERLVPAGEWQPRHGGRHADIDTDHAGIEAPLEFAGGTAILGKDRSAISVFTAIPNRDRFFQVCPCE